jgi:Trk K+ transport system NAD-binding subunit
MMDLTMAPGLNRTKEVILAGYGKVGKTVQETLSAAHISCTIVDASESKGPDLVGDVTDEETLKRAGIDDAGALILALGDDSDAVFATLVARKANSDVEIICRANDTGNVSKLYAAGADYVLALATVSGRMLAESILDEDVISYETQIDIVRTEAPAFAGQTLSEAGIRARTGCTVIAVERDGEIFTGLTADFELEAGDALVIAGADEDIVTFHEVAGVRSGDD